MSPSIRQLIAFVLAWSALVLLVAALQRVPINAWALLNAVSASVILTFIVVVHELVHVAAARLVRLEIHSVHIGAGHTFLRRNIGGVEVWWNAIPFAGGSALSVPDDRAPLARVGFALAAAPMFNILAAFALRSIDPDIARVDISAGLATGGLAFWALVLHTVYSLWPFPGSDGYQLLQIANQPDRTRDDIRAAKFLHPSEAARRDRDFDRALEHVELGLRALPNNFVLENSRAVIQLDREDYAAARAGFAQLLERAELTGLSRALVKNNLAWADLMLGTHDVLDEADEMSEAAYKAFTRMPYFMGTRGAVLIERGRIEDGIKLVRQSLGFHSEPRARAAMYCYLAIGAGRLGRTEEAKKHLQAAREIDAKSKLIPRAEQELGG